MTLPPNSFFMFSPSFRSSSPILIYAELICLIPLRLYHFSFFHNSSLSKPIMMKLKGSLSFISNRPIWWIVHNKVKLRTVLCHYWIYLTNCFILHRVSLVLRHKILPRSHKTVLRALVSVVYLVFKQRLSLVLKERLILILKESSIAEIESSCWKVIQRVNDIVVLVWQESLVVVRKISCISKVHMGWW